MAKGSKTSCRWIPVLGDPGAGPLTAVECRDKKRKQNVNTVTVGEVAKKANAVGRRIPVPGNNPGAGPLAAGGRDGAELNQACRSRKTNSARWKAQCATEGTMAKGSKTSSRRIPVLGNPGAGPLTAAGCISL